MSKYNLDQLGSASFERLCQSLLKEIIGNGTITFGAGKDGAREATFNGKAPYPSISEQWDGQWIFQVKFHDLQLLGVDKARKAVLTDLETELDKIVTKYKYDCKNYILITNVPLSSVYNTGNHDRIARDIVPRYLVLRARINGNEMARINGNEGGQKEARAGLWG